MTKGLYQILYCSRNLIRGTAEQVDAEIVSILQASQRNNVRVGVTGALFYNSVLFAQALEGKFSEVQKVFERLQLDARHADLVVLQSGYVAARDFGTWSMAHAGSPASSALPFALADDRDASAVNASVSGDKVFDFLREVVLKQNGWALPERPSAVRPITTSMGSAV